MANRHKFLFIYNEHCKKVELETSNPNGASIEELMGKASKLFSVDQTTIVLQKWDTEFECFVNIDVDEPAENIPGGVKIKVQPLVQVIPVHLENIMQPTAAAQPVVAEKPAEDTSPKDQATEVKEPDTAGRDVEMDVEEKDQAEAKYHKPVTCWAVNWKLPDLPPAIHKKLVSLPPGNDLRTSERSTVY